MAIRIHNNFKVLSDEEIKKTFEEIRENAMDAYILPIYVMLDLSGSMHSICNKGLHVLSCLKEQFSDNKCPCDAFLILSVIYDCTQKTDVPSIVYSGFISDFDFELFKKQIKECYGLTPLVNALNQVTKYGNMLIKDIDSKRVHSCPVNIFITDYVENVSNDEECYKTINRIQKDIEDEKCLAIEFVLTDSQALNMGVKERITDAISFGGFRCRYNDDDIRDIINALKMSSSTISEDGECLPPRSDMEKYNDHLRRTLITKMHEYWDKYDN